MPKASDLYARKLQPVDKVPQGTLLFAKKRKDSIIIEKWRTEILKKREEKRNQIQMFRIEDIVPKEHMLRKI